MPGLAGEAIGTRSALELYGQALLQGSAGSAHVCRVIADDGTNRRLPLERWLGHPDPGETELLAHAAAPVLDVGCGAGRHLAWLRSQRVPALGIDVAPGAVALARRRGLAVLQASVFDSLPASGCWRSALLLDGNIGIGGDPVSLLARVRSLLGEGACVFVELEPPGRSSRAVRVRIESASESSDWIPWAWMSADHIDAIAEQAGLSSRRCWQSGGRWFARLASEPRPRASEGARAAAG